MDKVLVQLHIPVTGHKYDIRIPRSMSVGLATELIASLFTGINGGAYMPDGKVVLCDMDTGSILNINQTVGSLKLKNGTHLMLI